MRLHSKAINEGQIKDSEVLALIETRMIEAGTIMTFQQTAAPTGWTKDTTAALNDAAIRSTTGTVGTGGADAFNTLFGTSKASAGYTLLEADIPGHSHSITPPHSTYVANDAAGSFGAGTSNASDVTFPTSTGSTGGGGSHAHDLSNMNLKFVDVIIASRDAV